MTWNPLRKSHIKRPTPAQPLLSVTEDRDLDVVVQRLRHIQDVIKRLTKETKRYVEAVANLDRTDQRLSSNLSNSGMVHTSDEFRRIVEEYHSITTQIGKSVPEVGALLQKTFIEPLKKLYDEFNLIATSLACREDLVGVWKSSYNRVKELQETPNRTANQVAKLEREKLVLERGGKELRNMHTRLVVEFTWFLDKVFEYIKPSVHALIMIQLDYYGNATRLYAQLMPIHGTSDSPSSAMMPEEEFQTILTGQMNRLKSLTIVKDRCSAGNL